jgi:hypothetical protein
VSLPVEGQPATPFAEAYQAAGRPRIVIFLNRRLSDAVTEWTSSERIAWDVERRSRYREDDISGDESGSRRTTVAKESRTGGQESGAPLDSSWEWVLEEAFLVPFLDAGVTLADRALIVRAEAASADAGERPDALKVEFKALEGKADILIELVARSSRTSAWGYQFKATAKSIRGGDLLAIATIAKPEDAGPGAPATKVITTPDGYRVVPVEIPPPQLVGEFLAKQMMRQLALALRSRPASP